jgi:prepilin-type N-terminal cleavage/methylation domain-containing protein
MRPAKRRPGFTLIELLVIVAIIGVLTSLLLPAVQKAREAANAIRCSNQLRQIGIGTHSLHQQYQVLQPGLGWFPNTVAPGAYGVMLFHLLPFIEQENLFQESEVGGIWHAGNNGVFSHKVPVFVCPSDPSAGDGLVQDAAGQWWGASSYAGNAQVFCRVAEDGSLISSRGASRISASFPDGTSQTILYTEKYARCTNGNYPTGGNFWAYAETGANIKPLHPGFAVSWNAYSIGPWSKFRERPTPYLGACDPTIASSPHPGGIHACMADSSVRFVSSGITPYTWWYACTPAGGETMPADW